MHPERLVSHDEDLELRPLDEDARGRGPSPRAGRIESNAQLAGVIQRDATGNRAGGPIGDQLAERIQAERAGGAPLPEREAIEGKIGADLSQARVHTGPVAAELSRSVGARAFTSGRDIFLGEGASLADHDLLAHEASHTVQQGMHEDKPREVGAAETAHEDAAASHDASGSESAGTVQRYTDDHKIAGKYARVSENQKVVVLGKDNYSQDLYATEDLIKAANDALKASGQKGSYLSLVKHGGNISYGGNTLSRVSPVFHPEGDSPNATLAKTNKGKDEKDTMSLWADCGRSSRVVMGSHGDQAPHATYGKGDGKEHDTADSFTPDKYSDEIYMATMPPFLQDKANADFLKKGVHYNANPSDIIAPTTADQARAQYQALTPDGKRKFDKFAHINTGANPHVGGGYTLNTEYGMPGFKEQGNMTWNFHWAGVVMKDGSDNITLENYADGNGYDSVNTDWNFQMYGTVKKDQTFYEQHLASGTHGNRATAFEVEPKGS
jgi:hypothetical protein